MNLKQQFSGVHLVVGLAIQLDGAEFLVLFKKCLGVLHQQRFRVAHVVVACEINGSVPLVQLDARVNSQL